MATATKESLNGLAITGTIKSIENTRFGESKGGGIVNPNLFTIEIDVSNGGGDRTLRATFQKVDEFGHPSALASALEEVNPVGKLARVLVAARSNGNYINYTAGQIEVIA